MTSPLGFMPPPSPLEGGQYQRDNEVPAQISRDAAMSSLNVPTQNRWRDGSNITLTGPQSPQRYLALPDPLTFRFLQEDPCVAVVDRRCVLRGYELFIVEQWACSRQSPLIVVTTHTGDEKHSIVAGVISIPNDQAQWSARLRLYFDMASQHNARPKHTDLGELMITNLSSFPSALTVIPVLDGDVRKHRQLFIVNEDLKRLGCSGRSGLALTDPTEATRAKFHQLYRTSERIPIYQSIIELIKLCQTALYMFEKLDYQYIDGLLCDVTEKAISNWWAELGAEHYNYEPTDGILGPSTVSALLGMLMGARNRLHWFGAPVSKDVFEIEATKRGVAYFQKQQKLEKTRRLDRQTVFRLHTATAKGAAGEGWGVQKAVKSTVTEIGGKRGEIVMDMVSGRDKGGLADVETLDIDKFISLAYGDRPRWLWHGKTRRTATDELGSVQDLGSSAFLGLNEPSNFSAKRVPPILLDEEPDTRGREDASAGPCSDIVAGSVNNTVDAPGERDAARRGVFKSVTDKMSDARSGFGRIKDVVGGNRRGQLSKLSISAKDEVSDVDHSSGATSSAAYNAATVSSPAVVGRAFTWKNKPEEYLASIKRGEVVLPSQRDDDPKPDGRYGDELLGTTEAETNSMGCIGSEIRKAISHKGSSTGPSVIDDADLRGPLLEKEQMSGGKAIIIARRRSCGTADVGLVQVTNETRWPRRMSFGDAEEAILAWKEVIDIADPADYAACMEAHAGAASHLNHKIEEIVNTIGPWAEDKVKAVELLSDGYERDRVELHGLNHQLNEAYQRGRYNSDELLSEQRENLTESVNEIEVLVARLDYEINGLVQKTHDLEDGIQGFERQVNDVESRAAELKVSLETESWAHWLVRTLTGVGTGPNITRET